MLFALPEYSHGAQVVSFRAVRALAVAQEPLLGRIRSQASESIPTSRITDGRGGEIELQPISVRVKLEMDIDSVSSGDLTDLFVALDDAARQEADALAQALFTSIDQITDMTGNRVDAGGRPLSWDTITDALETIEIAFDDDGKMNLTMVLHPDDLAKLEAAGPPTPEQERRHMEVLARKREEWLARKRDRRLR
ncbi:MAG: hypothetical protein M3P40_04320 [Actinomycetota bacterium]|nr:hypothetical protein [Actinomycetota bacterium]